LTNFPQPCKKVAALCIQCECVTSISFHNVGKHGRRFVLIRISVLFIVSTVLSSILLISSQFAYTPNNTFWAHNQPASTCSMTDVCLSRARGHVQRPSSRCCKPQGSRILWPILFSLPYSNTSAELSFHHHLL